MSLAVFALVASPVLAFLGVLLGHRTTRRSAVELDRWRKREETMRLLRWGTETALDAEQSRRMVGLEVLAALLGAPILDDEDRALVAAIVTAVARSVRLEPEEGRPP